MILVMLLNCGWEIFNSENLVGDPLQASQVLGHQPACRACAFGTCGNIEAQMAVMPLYIWPGTHVYRFVLCPYPACCIAVSRQVTFNLFFRKWVQLFNTDQRHIIAVQFFPGFFQMEIKLSACYHHRLHFNGIGRLIVDAFVEGSYFQFLKACD